MKKTVGRRIADGFVVGLGLAVVVVVVAVGALRVTSEAYRSALDQERRTLVPALQAHAEAPRAMIDYSFYLIGPADLHAHNRDSVLAVSRGLIVGLHDSDRTAESCALWGERA